MISRKALSDTLIEDFKSCTVYKAASFKSTEVFHKDVFFALLVSFDRCSLSSFISCLLALTTMPFILLPSLYGY